MAESLREFNQVHIDEDCRGLSGTHTNELFFNCVFDKLSGLNLVDCDLNESKFKTSSIQDALGFSMTLDCFSFKGVEYSPLLFDLLVVLMSLTHGNDEKRRKLVDVIGPEKMQAMKRVLGVMD